MSPGESCDDGNTDDGDGCSATCVLEPTDSASVDDATAIDISFMGALDETDYVWDRPNASCSYSSFLSFNTYADFYEVTNNTAEEISVTGNVAGDFDEFLHAYSSMSILDTVDCISGNDDDFFNGGSTVDASIAPGESVYFIVSSYSSFTSGTYTLTVE